MHQRSVIAGPSSQRLLHFITISDHNKLDKCLYPCCHLYRFFPFLAHGVFFSCTCKNTCTCCSLSIILLSPHLLNLYYFWQLHSIFFLCYKYVLTVQSHSYTVFIFSIVVWICIVWFSCHFAAGIPEFPHWGTIQVLFYSTTLTIPNLQLKPYR